MKYAVPVTGGVVSPHFGHCEQFALIDVDEGKREILKNELISSPPHEPGMLPGWLAQKGASIIIASGMGGRAVELFHQNHIDVVLGAPSEDPEKVVLAHMSGSLQTGANACDESHQHGCGH
jgi:ATP-binding protein involved in chromosome partitioning